MYFGARTNSNVRCGSRGLAGTVQWLSQLASWEVQVCHLLLNNGFLAFDGRSQSGNVGGWWAVVSATAHSNAAITAKHGKLMRGG